MVSGRGPPPQKGAMAAGCLSGPQCFSPKPDTPLFGGRSELRAARLASVGLPDGAGSQVWNQRFLHYRLGVQGKSLKFPWPQFLHP